MTNAFPKLHNAMWPGLVGKDSPGGEPSISLDRMLDLTCAAGVNGQKFDGVDLFLYDPHVNIDLSEDDVKRLGDKIASRGLKIGTLVAPVWGVTGGGSAMGDANERLRFVDAVRKACRIANILKAHGVREYGCIRIDSAAGHDNGASLEEFAKHPARHMTTIAETFKEAGNVAGEHGERLVAEGEICWAGMHTWRYMLQLLKEVDMPEVIGFQADLAHTYLYLLGYNHPSHALLSDGYSDAQFYAAYAEMTEALRPWTYDFHVAQNDGTVHGSGSHDKTGRHCLADDPKGKLDIDQVSDYWLRGGRGRGIRHICWDGCMFPNTVLEDLNTWNTVLAKMIEVREQSGWN